MDYKNRYRLTASDTEKNPGTARPDFCGVCEQIVGRQPDRGIFCVACSTWHHAQYQGTPYTYNGSILRNSPSKKTRFAANIRTNASAKNCPDDFLVSFADFLSQLLQTDIHDLILELQTNVTIIRDGKMDRAMNIDVHHNSDDINKDTKIGIAEQIAGFIDNQLKIPLDRTMVLFFDTRKCT